MTDQIPMELTDPKHTARRDEPPNALGFPHEVRCNHMKALSLGGFFFCHIPDMKFECLVCFDCMFQLNKLRGVYFLPAPIDGYIAGYTG